MILIYATEKQQQTLLVAMLLVTLCMYKSVHLNFFKSMD